MSGVVDVLVLPPVVVALFAGGPASAVLVGAGAAGYGAYSALERLRKDYLQGLQEFHARSAEEQQQREQLATEHEAATDVAVKLAGLTSVSGVENATLTFLREHARELTQHIAESSAPNEELLAQCQTLLEALETSPLETDETF